MIIVSLISFCLAAILLLNSIFRKSDFFSPACIYFFFHSLTLGISFLALNKAMTPFLPLTSLVYFGSAACYLLGTWLADLADGLSYKDTVRGRLNITHYNWKLHTILSFAIFFTFLWGLIVAYHGAGKFPLLAGKDQNQVIHDFFSVKWSASVAFSQGGTVMALFFMSIFRPRRLPKLFNLGFWIMSISLLLFSLALSRSGLIFFAVFAIVFYHQGIRRISTMRLSLIFVFSLLIFLFTGYLKFSDVEKEHSLDMKPTQAFQLLMKLPYLYVANNFWNLDYALNPENFQVRHPPTYGFTTISGLLDMMVLPGGALASNIRESGHFDDQFSKRSVKIRNINTMGYQWGLYKDFGVAGTLLLPFVFGCFFESLYLRARRKPTVLNLAAYSYLAFFVALSWFLAFWEAVIFVYGFLYIVLCCYCSQKIRIKPLLPRTKAGGPTPPTEGCSGDIIQVT